MGSAASNQNRVASAGLSREDGRNSSAETRSRSTNDKRPQSSSSAQSRIKPTYDLKSPATKKASIHKTEVTPLSPQKLEERKAPDSPSASGNDQQKKIRELEWQLAKSESHKLDLLEQISSLKQNHVLSKPTSVLPPLTEHEQPLQETAHAKDQYIVKLEKDLKAAQKELANVRQKLKKRIKALTNQLHEVRQEASISQMELKAVISQQTEQMENYKNEKGSSASKDAGLSEQAETGHSKIIVELSNQLSEQADKILSLEAELTAKDQKLQELGESSKKANPPAFDSTPASTDRLPSGRGKRTHKNVPDGTSKASPLFSSELPGHHRHTASTVSCSHEITPILERQSTALSDSDSDWELDSVPSKIHSAPAGARVKSAVSVSSSVKDDVTDMQGNDDSILNMVANSHAHGDNDVSSSSRRSKPYKRSALKTHLERKKNANQTNALIGPSLAFAPNSKEPPSDTSCEPTPRCGDRSHLPGFAGLHVVNSVTH